jgi:glutamine synthetase
MPTSKAEVLKSLETGGVKFLRLQFTDVLGVAKNVEVPINQFEKALDGQITFDGNSIEGFTRIEESDMLLRPDLETFRVFPVFSDSDAKHGRVARVICDVALPDGRPFEGDPRFALKRALEKVNRAGFDDAFFGPEVEFFLFQRSESGMASTVTNDAAGYFDLAPIDKGEEARRDMVNHLLELGFEVEGAHHEVAPGQHEIDFKYANALKTADSISTFKFVVKRVALEHNLHATFMPKPLGGINGSGMHLHMSLYKAGQNAFFDPKGQYQLSKTASYFIGGLLEHADGMVAVTNPLVNSYKRLVPGYEAPTTVAWSASNRSAMIRVPAKRGVSTRAELRIPDPGCNPYLAFAAILGAGLHGIQAKLEPPPPVSRNIYDMSVRDKRKHKVKNLPTTLREALNELESDRVIRDALGDHIYQHFIHAKREEWKLYAATVHDWELQRYLEML